MEDQLVSGAEAVIAISSIKIPPDLPKFVWDSETERTFARLVDPNVSNRTPLPTKGIS